MARDDAYRSSYDPRFSGKVEKPQAPQESHQLSGCGDPTCSMCNPETANRDFSSRPSGGFGSFSGGMPSEMREAMIASLSSFAYGLGGAEASASKPSAGKSPPSSFTDARKEVEAYLTPCPTQAFDDIVGNTEALGLLRDAIQAPVKHKELYEAYGMKVPKGVVVTDVVRSVSDLFEENRGLDHAFALDEFRRDFIAETEARQDRAA